MKKLKTGVFILTFLCLLVFSGCVSGPAFQEVTSIPEGKALVYIYRLPGYFGWAVSYDILADGNRIVYMRNGGYYPYITEPGKIQFSANTETAVFQEMDIKPGKTYYLQTFVGMGFWVGRPVFEVMDEKEGKKNLKSCKLLQE